MLNSVACSKLFRLLPRSRGNCGHFDALRFLGWRQESIWHNSSRSQHADANHTMALRKKPPRTQGPRGRPCTRKMFTSQLRPCRSTTSTSSTERADRPRFMPVRFGAIELLSATNSWLLPHTRLGNWRWRTLPLGVRAATIIFRAVRMLL